MVYFSDATGLTCNSRGPSLGADTPAYSTLKSEVVMKSQCIGRTHMHKLHKNDRSVLERKQEHRKLWLAC